MSSIEGGVGALLARGFVALLAILTLFAVYYRSQAPGLRSADAIELAQLARNLAAGRGFTTRCIRPADTWYLRKNDRPAYATGSFPDLRNAPLYPALLSLGLRLWRPPYRTESSILHARLRVFAPEQRVLVPTTVLFTIGTGVLVLLMGLRLFSLRAGLTAATAYFVTDSVLANGLSGAAGPATAFFATAALYLCALHRPDKPPILSMPFIAAGIVCGLTFLVRYAAIVVLPASLLVIFIRLDQRKWAAAATLLFIAATVTAPWLLRNVKATGGPFGMAPYSVLTGSVTYPGDSFDRDLSPHPDNVKIARAVRDKALTGIRRLYDSDLRTLGSGLLVCFFLVSLFVRSEHPDASVLKWATAMGLACLLFVVALTDGNRTGILDMFLPMVTLCAVVFFFELLDRFATLDAEWQTVLTWAVLLLTALPAICTIAGAQRRSPYPPYHPPFVSYVTGLLEPDEIVCTDIPWATAWYGDRNSMLLPGTLEKFMELHNNHMPMSGLYFTTETTDRGYAGDLLDGPGRSWLPVLNRQVPTEFPLKHGIALPPGQHDQLFLTDRIRWQEEPQPAEE